MRYERELKQTRSLLFVVVTQFRRGIRVRAGIVEVVEGQDIEGAKVALRKIGVTDIVSDRARGVGRAAHGVAPAVSELCGRCGKGRAAIGMDGQLTPCVLGRFLVAGNVKDTPLVDLFAGPRWWAWAESGSLWYDSWELRDGPSGPAQWLDSAYSDRSLITQVGELHADQADPGDRPTGRPSSSATMPGLLVQMYRHAMISDGMDVLDVGTGSGYGTALLCTRLGDGHVTGIDLDDYLAKVAADRLASIGLHPVLTASDAAGPLPGGAESFDRIIATVAVRPIPASWLTALRPGGRLVTTISGTNLILTADKTSDGGAIGRTEWDRAGFMFARKGPSYSPEMMELFTAIRDADGDCVTAGRFPVTNVNDAWELYSTLGLTVPGIEHHFEQAGDGTRTAWMLHPDGSWARATAVGDEPSVIHQAGPQRLHDILDRLRDDWLRDGSLPAYGARVTISPDGTLVFRRGRWTAIIAAD